MDVKRPSSISELDELRLIYYEILDGCSFDSESSFYIKHFSDRESALIVRKRAELFRYYINAGVPHESDALKAAIANEEWSQDKEDNVLSLKYEISDNERCIHNIIPEQRGGIEAAIEATKQKLGEALFERKQVLGRTVEDLIDDDVNDLVVYLSFFKDSKLTIPIEPTYEDFQNWEPDRISELNARLNAHYRRISEDKLKGISCLPLFMNKLGYAKDNISIFLGKTACEFTHNQSFIFSFGIRNINLLSTAKGSPPDLNLEAKISELVRWYDLQHSLNIGKRNSSD